MKLNGKYLPGGVVSGSNLLLVGNPERDRPEFIIPKEVLDKLINRNAPKYILPGTDNLCWKYIAKEYEAISTRQMLLKWLFLAVGLIAGASVAAVIILLILKGH